MLLIRTFSAAGFEAASRTLGPGKAVALLAYLSASPTRSTPRRDAFHLLYSDDSAHNADAFRQLLASLRKLLPGTFVTSGDLLQLTEALPSDRQAFLDAAARGDHEEALALYTAEFFDPFDEPGCDGFRRWAHEERLRLRRRFEGVAECVVRRQLARAEFDGALASATSVAQRFPGLAVSARLLIETLLLSGRAGDIRATLTDLGATRVGAASSSNPRALDQLIDALSALARTYRLGDPSRPLIGREPEFRSIVEAWNTARTGAGGTVLVSGPRGGGASRLLANLAIRLRIDTPSCIGPMTVEPDADETASIARQLAVAILPLPGALGTTPQHYLVLKRLASGEPVDADAPADRQARMVVEALIDGLRAASEEAPVAVLIDTRTNAVSDAARMLSELSARLRSARVLFVITSSEPLASVIETTSREQLALTGLDPDQITILAASAGTTLSAADTAAMHAETGGLPGLLRARFDAPDVRAASPAGTPRSGSTSAPAPDRPVPVTVRSWYRRPLSRAVSVAVLSVVGLIVTTRAIRSADATVPEESFTVFTWQDDSVTTETFVIGDDDTTAMAARFRNRGAHRRWLLDRVPERIRISPDSSMIAVQIETNGPNTMDIIGLTGDTTVDLASGPTDDTTPDWSPDGRLLAFSSNRWSTTGNDACDIGVREMRTGTISRVTSGPDCDIGPRWTIDGRGLAFLRQFHTGTTEAAICTLPTFDATTTCTPVDSTLHGVQLIGWQSETSILYAARTGTSSVINAMDITTRRSIPINSTVAVVEAELSPSRRYIACWCSSFRDSLPRILLLDLTGGRPLYDIEVAPDAPFRQIAWHTRGALRADDPADRIAFLRRLDSASNAAARSARSADTLTEARAKMQRSRGVIAQALRQLPVPPAPVEWTPTPERPGAALLEERWDIIDTARWVPFGLPRPRASRALNGFDPGGDGSYPSGLYLREAFTAPQGFVVEARVSARISLPQWQGFTIFAESDRYASAIGRWNHRDGWLPLPKTQMFFESGIQYPGPEGGDRAMRLSLSGAGGTALVPISPAVGDGRDVVWRVEYGADSVMTVFANGMRVASRPYAPTRDGRYRLFLWGHSVESAVRVRYLRVWGLGGR